jgi:peptidoglycan/xylan/chitin deacetylase (PgdA/CDA1 family)
MIKYLLGYFGQTLLNVKKIKTIYSKSEFGVYPIILHDIPPSKLNRLICLLDFLLERYTFITPNNFVLYLNGDYNLSENQLLLTFDDGFYSNYLIANNVLKPRNINAIFFISTGFIGLRDNTEIVNYIQKKFYNDQFPSHLNINEMIPMTWSNILDLVELGHTIGAHTVNHVRLSRVIDSASLEEEIISSGEHIEDILGLKVDHFAFPFGDIGSINTKALKVAGEKYKYIYSGIRGCNDSKTNPLALRRESMNILDEFTYNMFIAGGGLSFYYWKNRQELDKLVANV